MVLKAELDREQSERLGRFLTTGPVDLFVEDNTLFVKMQGGNMTITVKMQEVS